MQECSLPSPAEEHYAVGKKQEAPVDCWMERAVQQYMYRINPWCIKMKLQSSLTCL